MICPTIERTRIDLSYIFIISHFSQFVKGFWKNIFFGKGGKNRTLISGFGDRYVAITPHPYDLRVIKLARTIPLWYFIVLLDCSIATKSSIGKAHRHQLMEFYIQNGKRVFCKHTQSLFRWCLYTYYITYFLTCQVFFQYFLVFLR